jgi:hypothetical protein
MDATARFVVIQRCSEISNEIRFQRMTKGRQADPFGFFNSKWGYSHVQ